MVLRYTWADSSSPLSVELYYSGDWQDVTGYLSQTGITIVRGLRSEGSRAQSASAELTLKNDTGRFTPYHPESPLYGLIGRSTPLRIRVQVDSTWYTRFVGEVASWEQSWGLTGPESSVTLVTAAGAMRQLGVGEDQTRSSMYRGTSGSDSTLLGYWPMEEGTRATSWTADRGNRDGAITGSPAFAGHDTFACSDPIPTIGTSRSQMEVPPYTDTGEWQVRSLVYIPAATPDQATILSCDTTGSITQVGVKYSTGGALRPFVTRSDGSTYTWTAIAYDADDTDSWLSLELTQDGSDVNIRVSVLPVGGEGITGLVVDSSQTIGMIRRCVINPARAALWYLAMGHMSVWDTVTSLYDLADPLVAWEGERAAHRIYRLTEEAGLSVALVGDDATSQRMGQQGRGALLDLIEEAADVGAGILYEGRDTGTLTYRSLSGIVHQDPDLTITYTDNLLIPFKPDTSDRYAMNRSTVRRRDGASATVGVGTPSESVTKSLGVDGQAAHQAGWRVGIGTVEGPRWPQIGVNLAHPTMTGSAALTAGVLALEIGDRLDITSLPAWLSPDGVAGLVLGYTETITPEDYRIVYVVAPYDPYRVARWHDTGIADRYDQRTTVTTGALTTTSTAVPVTSTSPPYWAHDGTDYDLVIAGEVVTLTGVTGAGPAQTLTVTRSINGVTKAHDADTTVSLADPVRYGLGS